MRNALSNYNALKVFKLNLSVTFFFEQNELSMNLGQIFDKILKIMHESYGFSFSKLFAGDLS